MWATKFGFGALQYKEVNNYICPRGQLFVVAIKVPQIWLQLLANRPQLVLGSPQGGENVMRLGDRRQQFFWIQNILHRAAKFDNWDDLLLKSSLKYFLPKQSYKLIRKNVYVLCDTDTRPPLEQGCMNSWVVSHLAQIISILHHALGREFKPQRQQTLFWTQEQHLRFSFCFILFDTIICLSNLSREL